MSVNVELATRRGRETRTVQTSATSLNWCCSRIITVDDGLRQLTGLRRLQLFTNELEALPSSLLDLHTLECLDVSRNAIKSLDGVGRLTALTVLLANHLPLQALPRDLGCLRQVVHMSVANCGLRSLPASMGQLSCLETLALHDNLLSWLPCELDRLPARTRIFLRGNQMPIKIVENRPPFNSRPVLPDIFANTTRLEMLRDSAMTLAIGLQDLELPALVTLEIIDAAWDNDVRMFAKWQIVTTVKHFHDK